MAPHRIPKNGLHCTPPGKRKRPRTTWRRTITTELQEMVYTMGQAQFITKDRSRWWQIVDALCTIGDEEDNILAEMRWILYIGLTLSVMITTALANDLLTVVNVLTNRDLRNTSDACSIHFSREIVRCDVDPTNDFIPHGAICSFKDEKNLYGTIDAYICMDGYLINIDHLHKGTMSEHVIQKRFFWFLAVVFVVTSIVVCLVFCGHRHQEPNHAPEWKNCPGNLQDQYAEILQNTALVTWNEPTANDRDNNLKSTNDRGKRTNSMYEEGHHVITYTADDDLGALGICEVTFKVVVIYCKQSLFVENGRFNCTTSIGIYGTTCNIYCNNGYQLPPLAASNVTCDKYDSTGVWDPKDSFQCEKKKCQPPVSPCNGEFVCSSDDYSFETYCLLKCKTGYSTDSTLSLTCNGDNWIGSVGTCDDIQPPEIRFCPGNIHAFANEDGFAVVDWPSITAIDNSVYADSCNNNSPLTITQVHGQHSGSRFEIGYHEIVNTAEDFSKNTQNCSFTVTVEELVCNPLVVDDQFLLISCTEGYSLGASCWFSCFLSYQLTGDVNVTCTQDLDDAGNAFWNWSNNTQSYCEKLACPELPAPAGGALACSEALGNQICTISCSDKYQMAKNTPLQYVCNDEQVWIQGIPPNCTDLVHPSDVYQPGELFYYYSGDCSDPAVQEGIKKNFVDVMENLEETEQWENICPSYCTVEGVTVTCGPLNGRRRRELESEHKISKRAASQITLNFKVSSEWDTGKNLWGNDDVLTGLTDLMKANLVSGTFDVANVSTGNMAIGWIEISCPVGQDPVYDSDGRCVGCPPGEYLKNHTCIKCEKGYFQDKEYQINCTKCPVGQSTKGFGSTNLNQCKDICQPGTYSSTGVVPCMPCFRGHYQLEYGSISCEKCPASQYTISMGSKTKTDCQTMDIHFTTEVTTIELQPVSEEINSFTIGTYIKCANSKNKVLEIKIANFNLYVGDVMTFVLDSQTTENATFETVLQSKWTHVLFTWNQLDVKGSIYVNGHNVAEQTFYLQSINDSKIDEGDSLQLKIYLAECSLTDFFMTKEVEQLTKFDMQNDACLSNVANAIYSMDSIYYTEKQEFQISYSSCDAFDNCVGQPCGENNICKDLRGGFSCNCTGGYRGPTCNIPPDFCLSNICENGATCVRHFRNYTCQCASGYKGVFCEKEIINGNWGDWIESPCTKSCGNGTKTRSRYCNNPIADPDGKGCEGQGTVKVICNTQECPVCDPVQSIYAYKNDFNCTTKNGTIICTVSCQPGYVFLSEFQPLSVYECGPHTDFSWNGKPPPCVDAQSPRALETNANLTYDDGCAAKEGIVLSLTDKLSGLQCITNQTCNATVKSSGCSNNYRNKRSTNSLEVTVQLYSEMVGDSDLKLDDFYANKIVSPSLLSLVQAYVDSANSLYQINSSDFLTVDVDGSLYTADISEFNVSMNAECVAGTVEQDLVCVHCSQGTYWKNRMCVICPEGTFQDELGQLECKLCAFGFTTRYKASTSESDCSVTMSTTAATTLVSSSDKSSTEIIVEESDEVIPVVIPIVVVVLVAITSAILIKIYFERRIRRSGSYWLNSRRKHLVNKANNKMANGADLTEGNRNIINKEINYTNDGYDFSKSEEDIRYAGPPAYFK